MGAFAVIEQRIIEPSLPKPVIDRVARFAREGRQLRAVFGPEDYRLVATAVGQLPVVVVRAHDPERFAGLRSAVVLEWSRVTRSLAGRKRPGRHRLPTAS
ncbi:MAG: hypothetical protein KIT09_12175 [Bryobacteraceae bacterium]|nr:hypothetical protein [Bryobacteraceae bacterium]